MRAVYRVSYSLHSLPLFHLLLKVGYLRSLLCDVLVFRQSSDAYGRGPHFANYDVKKYEYMLGLIIEPTNCLLQLLFVLYNTRIFGYIDSASQLDYIYYFVNL